MTGHVQSATDRPAIMVAEDNFLTASHVCGIVRDCGFDATAVPQVKTGLDFLARNRVDGAIVDIDLRGTYSFGLCQELVRRKVPYVFLTAYQPSIIPEPFRTVPVLPKPPEAAAIRSALRGLLLEQRPGTAWAEAAAVPDNAVLRGLAPEDRQALQARLEPMTLAVDDVLERPGIPASHLVFPSSGVISVEAGSNGSTLQVAMIGREGLAGTSLLLGRAAAHTAAVQYGGFGWRLPASEVWPLLAQRPRLREGLLEAAGAVMAQMSSNALAVGRCTIEQRVARWLLMASRRIGSDEIALTHDTLARMLAVRRSGVTVALHALEGKGVLRSTRGRVRLVGPDRLAELAGRVAPA